MKLVHGVGLNDSDERVVIRKGKVVVWRCPFYIRWANMLKRCHNKSSLEKRKEYVGCKVHPDWHRFSVFKEWMKNQDWEGKHLDKDLLGDSTLYSEETCIFLDNEVNNFIKEDRKTKDLPMGVQPSNTKGKFLARIRLEGNDKHLGTYDSVEEASKAYLSKKLLLLDGIISRQSDSRIVSALRARYRIEDINC